MKIKTDSHAFRFFAINLFAPLLIHFVVAVISLIGPDLRQLYVALPVIVLINAANLTMAALNTGWVRIGFLVIASFNLLSLFAMGALSFLTSLFGWLDIVPDLVALFYQHPPVQ